MAALTGNKIKDSYLGLLKSISNDAISSSFVQISDGGGNALPLYLSTASIRFYDAYTFPSATGTVGQVLSADASGNLVFSDQLDNQTLEQVLTRGNAATLAILSTADSNTFGSTTFSNTVTLANNSVVSGTPPSASNNSTKIATTAYVDNQVSTQGVVKKTGTIAANKIAVWNDAVDTLRSDSSVTILSDGTITLYQPNNTSAGLSDSYSYNIGGGNFSNRDGTNTNEPRYNTGFGLDNLSSLTTGRFNTAIGNNSLMSLTVASQNVAVGYDALQNFNGSGTNTAVGHISLTALVSGVSNTAMGRGSLASVVSGSNNTAIGDGAAQLQTGSNNIHIGNNSSWQNVGSNNIFIGYQSGFFTTLGSNNVFIGGYKGVDNGASPVTLNNHIVLSDGSQSERITINATGAIRFHNYNASVNLGTPTSIIGTDASGNVVKTPIVPDGPTTDKYILEYDRTVSPNVFSWVSNLSSATVGGTGTAGTIAKWATGGANIEDSIITESASAITVSGDVKVNEVNPLIFVDSTSTNKASGIITSESGTSKWAIGTNFGSSDDSFNIYNYTAASRYLTISSVGNVGIGVSPATKLHIRGTSASTDSTLQIVGNGVSTLLLGQNARGGVIRGQGGSNELAFFVGGAGDTAAEIGTETMRIASGGNLTSLAQSTTAPSLTMGAAAGQIFKNEDLEFAFGLNNASPYNAWMQTRFNGNASRNFSINPLGGDVGIGTDSPSAKLQIHTTTNAGNAEVAAFLVNNSASINTEVRLAFAANTNDIISTGRYSYISAKNTSGSNGQDLVFATNATGASATPKLTISSGGDATFGGSVAVSELLTITQVDAGTTANKGLKLTNTTGTRNWNITAGRFDTNNDDFTIRCADTDVDALFISPSGNATFGGDIIARGSVTRNISFLGTGASPESLNAQIQYDQVNDTTGQLFFKTSNSGTLETRLTISSVGNVGIGNNNPSRPLDITADSGAVALKLRARVSNDFAFMSFYNHQNTVAWAEIAGTGTSSAATSLDFYVGATKKMSISSSGLATFQSSVQEKIKLIASSSEYLSLAFANNSGTTQWEISKGNSNELYFYRGGGGVDQGIKLTIESGGVMVKNGNSDSARIIPATDNVGYLGESSHRWQAVYAVNGSIQTSDRNEKTLITTSDLGLDFILKLEPISYKWKVGGWDIVENGKNEEPTKTPIDGKRNHYGLIAQQVKEVIGEKDFGGWVKEDLEDVDSMESLRYDQFISPMIKAIQEQQAIIANLIIRLEALEA